MYFMKQDAAATGPPKAGGNSKLAFPREVSATYDDLSTSRWTKRAAAFWPKDIIEPTGFLSRTWKGNKPEDFARPEYPGDLVSVKRKADDKNTTGKVFSCAARAAVTGAAGEKKKEAKKEMTTILEDWVGRNGINNNTLLEAVNRSVEEALQGSNLEDLSDRDYHRVQCEIELACTRHGSYNSGSRIRHAIPSTDEFEVAAKDWEIESSHNYHIWTPNPRFCSLRLLPRIGRSSSTS